MEFKMEIWLKDIKYNGLPVEKLKEELKTLGVI